MSEGHDAPMRPVCWVLIGLPGSGKSTWRAAQVERLARAGRSATVISTDDLIETFATAIGTTYTAAFRMIEHQALLAHVKRQFRNAAELRHDIIVDRTNLDPVSRALWTNRLAGYRKIAAVFEVREDTQRERLARASRAGKVIPEAVLAEKRAKFTRPMKGEGFDLVWTFQDSVPATARPIPIAA